VTVSVQNNLFIIGNNTLQNRARTDMRLSNEFQTIRVLLRTKHNFVNRSQLTAVTPGTLVAVVWTIRMSVTPC